MERIAPLAKILAEANGIDWQHLHGSGEGGLIVEQDILNYLTRIMSGEEEPPATPVDAPPPEWTGTELPPGGGLLAPGMPSMDMLSSAGVDSDLAALVSQPAAVPTPGLTAGPALDEDALEFELEDEAELAPLVPDLAPDIVAPMPDLSFASGTGPLHAGSMHTEPALPSFTQAPVAESPATQAPPEMPAAQAAAAPTGGVVGGLGNLLSRLYQAPARPEAPPEVPQPGVLQTSAAPSPVHFSAPEPALPAELPQPGTPAASQEAASQEDERPADQPVRAEAAVPTPPAEAGTETTGTETLPVAATTAAQAQPQGAVWFGSYLRRDVNVEPAAELRRQLTGALSQDVPLALLVARAAQRHAESLGLESVALHSVGAGRARTARPGGLREALAALDTDVEATPSLLVTDAGALDLDDLHLPHTLTLSVGRVQGGRAALSLQGDVDPAQGARFLAGVAATLEEPIILVI